MNVLIYSGRLTSEPKVRIVGKDKLVCEFIVAVKDNHGEKDSDGKDKAVFVRTIAWGSHAKACGKFLEKGQEVTVKGKLDIRRFYDKNGEMKWATECVAESIEFGRKPWDGEKGEKPQPPVYGEADIDLSDIPL